MSDGWQLRRQSALERAKHRCQDCGRTGGLDVHHLTYRRVGRERLRDLRAVCRECHRKRHRGYRSGPIDALLDWLGV
jgi:5-methylcytosine-specific restriction endonuclease McrA